MSLRRNPLTFAAAIGLMASFAVMLSVPRPASADEFSLISRWTLDEASGTRVDSQGDNDLTAVNDIPGVAGYSGNGVWSSTASSTYLTVADSASLSTTGATTFKISLWVKLTSKSGTQVFVSKYDGSGQGEYAVYYEHSYKRFIFSTYSNGGLGNHYVLADALGEPALGTWYHIEATHDGVENVNTIVVNEAYSNSITGVPAHQDTAAAFRIGAFGPSPMYFANAVIDDVRFYKRASPATQEGLAAYWRFDEGSGTTAVDWGGTNNATVSGAAYSTSTPPAVEFFDPYSLNFDGVDDGVSTPLSLNGSSAFTLAGWAYPRTAENGEGWFGANNVFEFFFSGGNALKCWTPEAEVDWEFNPSTFLNSWHHITCLGTGTSVDLYVDGVQVGSSAHPLTGNYGSGDNFSIGRGVQDGGTSGPFDGLIDDVRVYSRALTPAEMQSLGTGSEEPKENPIASSFSPLDDATGVSTSANLVVTFSTSTIAASTGSISIYRTSDDSLFESIPVDGERLSLSGAVATIDPSGALDEGTEYYVHIPSTAFMDAAGLFYAGTASTTWSFATGDFTAPTISSVAATSTSSTTASVSWVTDEESTTNVVYGFTAEYGGMATNDDQTSVTSHAETLSELVPCTVYQYAVVSADAAENVATSDGHTFITAGCGYAADPSTSTSTPVSVASGGSTMVSTSSKSFTVSVPPGATATSSSFYIQVKAVPSEPVLAAYGRPPAASNEVGVTVFDVKAIVDGTTILDTFDAPIGIEYEYTDDEIAGLSESTLWLYHYHRGSWQALDDCSVDMAGNRISCETDGFSVFGLFGNPPAAQSAASASSRPSGGASVRTRVANLVAMGNLAAADALRAQWPQLFAQAPASYPAPIATAQPVRDLAVGMSGDDVRALQTLLMAKRYAIPAGATGYFGGQTRAALSAYQRNSGVRPAAGYFGSITRAQMKSAGLSGLWW